MWGGFKKYNNSKRGYNCKNTRVFARFAKFDTCLYHHFKNNGHSPTKVLFQPGEKIKYDPNSSSRLKNIKRHETEPKWIKFLQSHIPLGFNDNIYHEGNISKMPDFGVFLFWNVKNVKVELMVNNEMATLSAKFVLKNL